MLTAEENHRLTRVEGQAPMGQLVRRFWLPFLLSTDLAGPDCVPVRVRLLGENLVAFRDTSGKVGLIDTLCAHRKADLFYGRNEEDGLRCVYHGWKYDVSGQCVECPTEPADSNFKYTLRLRSYPVVERAGVCWTHMGPPQARPAAEDDRNPSGRVLAGGIATGLPELPDFEWMRVPESHLYASWSTQDCNFVQAIEGGIDSVHSVYLHSTLDSHRNLGEWKRTGMVNPISGRAVQNRFRTKDNPPRLSAVDTDFGVLVGSCYPGEEGEDYWRCNLFLAPFYSMPPGGAEGKLCHAFVPIDDVTTARWSFTFNLKQPHGAREVASMRLGSGVHVELVPGTHTPLRRKSNNYLIDREEQRTLTFTGIAGIGEQDFAVQEGMGQIVDRTDERLTVSDVGITQMRKRLLKMADDLQEGGVEPYAASHTDVYRVHAGDALLPSGDPNWVEAAAIKEAIAARW